MCTATKVHVGPGFDNADCLSYEQVWHVMPQCPAPAAGHCSPHPLVAG